MSSDAAFVGSIPDYYDRGLGPVIFADYAAEMARRAAALEPSKVLETAAGTGIVTRELRDRLPKTARLTATDLNEPMLDVARKKFRNGEQVDFRQADATALRFADGAFDAVVCQFGLMFFPDKDKSFREAHRVLLPGGRYLFSVWDSHRHNPFGRITHELMQRLFPNDPPQFYKVPFSCSEIDPIKEMLISAGFTDIEISVIAIVKEAADMAALAGGAVYGNPMIEQIRARMDPAKIHAKVVEEFSAAFGTSPAKVPLQTIFYSARRP